MDNKNIILDFDHTLYSGKVNKHKRYYYNMLRNVFDDMSNAQFTRLCNKYKVNKDLITSDDVVEIAIKEGKDAFDKVSYYLSVNDEGFTKTASTNTISNETILDLVNRNFKIFVVSNSPTDNVMRNAKALGIDTRHLNIVGMPYRAPMRFMKNANKMERYKLILENTGCDPHNVLVIGNDYLADIKPAIHLGLHAVVCNDARLLTTENIINAFEDKTVSDMQQVNTLEYRLFADSMRNHTIGRQYVTIPTFDEIVNKALTKGKTKNKIKKQEVKQPETPQQPKPDWVKELGDGDHVL